MATIQVRNVPEHVSRALKAKAALAGMSLSDYLLAELQLLSNRPSRAEIMGKLANAQTRDLPPASEILAAQRGAV